MMCLTISIVIIVIGSYLAKPKRPVHHYHIDELRDVKFK